MSAPTAQNREERPAPEPSYPGHAGQAWRDAGNTTTETHQQQHRHTAGSLKRDATQLTSGEAADTIAQGRRIYLGNLLYRIKPDEIEEMLATNGFGEEVETVHISIDAMTGRNPGYCFIDFKTRTGAQMALESLAGTSIQGRPVKVGPCQPKRAEARWRSADYKPTFQRWGDWKGPRQSDPGNHWHENRGTEQGPYGALDHLNEVRKVGAPARVFVGGLGKMINQVENDKEIRGYFDGFNVFVFLSITLSDFLLDIHITERRKLTNEAANSEESQSANESSPIHPREQSPEIIITVSSISKAQRQPKLP